MIHGKEVKLMQSNEQYWIQYQERNSTGFNVKDLM